MGKVVRLREQGDYVVLPLAALIGVGQQCRAEAVVPCMQWRQSITMQWRQSMHAVAAVNAVVAVNAVNAVAAVNACSMQFGGPAGRMLCFRWPCEY